jgi:molecular chaperone IbpA
MANVLTLTTPLMRQTIGFDRFNDLFERLMSDASDGYDNYPPYNIEKIGDDQYRITMAIAGFTMDDLNVVLQDGELTVSGHIRDKDVDDGVQVLHRGIAARAFQKTFRLADYIKVTSAEMKDGLLTVSLMREIPEEKKPRMIPIQIGGTNGKAAIEHKKAKN